MAEELKLRNLTTRDVAPVMKVVGKAIREEITKAFDVLKTQIQVDEKRIDGVMKQGDKHDLQLGSFERRLSRHSEHLNSLESRLKALERK